MFDGWEMHDLTMTLAHDTPAFPVGLQDVRIVRDVRRANTMANSDKIEMSCHAGTHLDGPLHFEAQGKTINQISLARKLFGEGVVVDISDQLGDYDFYGEAEILKVGVEIRQGDILFIHTGYHRYAPNEPEADEIRYFFKHPGPKKEFTQWVKKMKLNYLGVDASSQDHPLNTGLQGRLPVIEEEFCEKHGLKSVAEFFPRKGLHPMHTELFKHEIIHIENLGGEIDQVLNKRVMIGAFPLKLVSESSPCRVAAWVRK
ncbi:MAG: cyclase family protein [Nitrospinota bacterium]